MDASLLGITSHQRFLLGGVPCMGIVLWLLSIGGIFLLCRRTTPRNDLGQLQPVAKIMMALCGVQSLFGVFLLFSSQQLVGLSLSQIPLLIGIFGLYTVDPVLLLLYTAILFFYLPTIQSLPANLGIDSCNAQFANDDFCVQGWITFLSFLAVLVTYISIIIGANCAYFFTSISLDRGLGSVERRPLLSTPAAPPSEPIKA